MGEICRDVVVAVVLAGDQMEAATRERLGQPGAAEMNYGGEFLLVLRAGRRVWPVRENPRDIAVQEYRRELGGVAWHDPRMEQGRGTAGLDDGMVENAIALRLRQRGVGHLVHADSARGRLVDLEG